MAFHIEAAPSLELRNGENSGDQKRGADRASPANQRHEDVGRDCEAREGPGAHLVNEQKAGDDREGADDAAERCPPRHCADDFRGRKGTRHAKAQHPKKRDDGQKGEEAPRIGGIVMGRSSDVKDRNL